jgi:hypothetical protein
MMHWKAKHLVPSLLDDTLDPAVEIDLRVHVANCARCRRIEREYAFSDSLLQRLPAALLPIQQTATSYGRLVSLSRWYDDPAIAADGRWRAPALTAASVVIVFMMAVTLGAWSPIVGSRSGAMGMASGIGDLQYLPTTWTTNRY